MIHLKIELRGYYFLKFDEHSPILRANLIHPILEHCEEVEGQCPLLILHFQKVLGPNLNLTDS